MECCRRLQCIDSKETMMIKWFANELGKTSLMGSWHTEDFDSKNLLFNFFSRSIYIFIYIFRIAI